MAKAKKKDEEAAAEEKDDESKDAKAKDEGKGAAEGEAGGAEGAEGEGAPVKKSKKKIIIIGVLALLLLLGGAAGAYFAGLFGTKSEEVSEEGVPLGPDGKPIIQAVYYTLPEFLVNLNTGGKQSSFLKATIILEVAKQSDVGVIETNLPRLQDAYNTYLRELRSSDLAGSAGIQRLREELLLRANKAVEPMKINDVLFKEIVVQ